LTVTGTLPVFLGDGLVIRLRGWIWRYLIEYDFRQIADCGNLAWCEPAHEFVNLLFSLMESVRIAKSHSTPTS
jgi:hypothetical protein